LFQTGNEPLDVLAVLIPKLEAYGHEQQQRAPSATAANQRLRTRGEYKESAVIPDEGTPDITPASTPSTGAPRRATRALLGLLSAESADTDDLMAM